MMFYGSPGRGCISAPHGPGGRRKGARGVPIATFMGFKPGHYAGGLILPFFATREIFPDLGVLH
ncbi:MAG: hypothetical protein CM15mP74_31030 [Halieaceae bacterium]|nr:MAG: hypothetical protein CM15mP74_31030 [Halieaceae bacterium]